MTESVADLERAARAPTEEGWGWARPGRAGGAPAWTNRATVAREAFGVLTEAERGAEAEA